MTIIRKELALINDNLNTTENKRTFCFQDLYDCIIDHLMGDQSAGTSRLQTQPPTNNKRKSSDSLESPAAKRSLIKARRIFISQVEKRTR